MRIYEYAVTLVESPKVKLAEYGSFEDAVVKTTCDILQIEPWEITQRNRAEKVKRARWIIWEIMMACKEYTLNQVGSMFGDPYDHTTVVHGLNTLVVDLQKCQYLQLIYDYIIRALNIDMNLINEFREERAFRAKDRKIRHPQIHVS